MAEPEFTERLRTLLKGNQKAASEATGINRQTLKGIASGKGTTVENWAAIADAFEKRIVVADK